MNNAQASNEASSEKTKATSMLEVGDGSAR